MSDAIALGIAVFILLAVPGILLATIYHYRKEIPSYNLDPKGKEGACFRCMVRMHLDVQFPESGAGKVRYRVSSARSHSVYWEWKLPARAVRRENLRLSLLSSSQRLVNILLGCTHGSCSGTY